MPVATGIRVFQGPWRVSLIHLSLNLGTLCLAIGFLTYQPGFFLWASGLLAISFSVFLLSVIWALWRDSKRLTKREPTLLIAIRFAILSLMTALFRGLFQLG